MCVQTYQNPHEFIALNLHIESLEITLTIPFTIVSVINLKKMFCKGIEGCGFGPNTVNPSLPPSQPWSHITDAFGLYNFPITPSNQVEISFPSHHQTR